MTIYVHNGDIGTVFELTIVDTDEVPIDVSTAAVDTSTAISSVSTIVNSNTVPISPL